MYEQKKGTQENCEKERDDNPKINLKKIFL